LGYGTHCSRKVDESLASETFIVANVALQAVALPPIVCSGRSGHAQLLPGGPGGEGGGGGRGDASMTTATDMSSRPGGMTYVNVKLPTPPAGSVIHDESLMSVSLYSGRLAFLGLPARGRGAHPREPRGPSSPQAAITGPANRRRGDATTPAPRHLAGKHGTPRRGGAPS
jgi:hypothetical protein